MLLAISQTADVTHPIWKDGSQAVQVGNPHFGTYLITLYKCEFGTIAQVVQ